MRQCVLDIDYDQSPPFGEVRRAKEKGLQS